MSADLIAFVDSNVLVYAVSDNEPEKQKVAREIVARGFTEGCFAISTQVMMETYVNITRKAKVGLPLRDALEYVRAFAEWTVVEMTPEMVVAALDLSQRSMISPWDAGILEAARQAGCRTVLSEDLGHSQVYGGITVQNPFTALRGESL
jgi:predicted nucleic acid-binding protein